MSAPNTNPSSSATATANPKTPEPDHTSSEIQYQTADASKCQSWDELRKLHPSLPEKIPIPTRSVECNSMSYIDDKDVTRQIWIPKGTLQTACKLFDKKDWEGLKKWPTYVDQGYADEGEPEDEERETWACLVDESDKGEKSETKSEESGGVWP